MKVRLLMLALVVAATAARAQPDPATEAPTATGGDVPGATAPEARSPETAPDARSPETAPEARSPDTAPEARSITTAPEPPSLDDLLWVARPLVIFADTDRDPRYIQQMRRIEAGMEELSERQVVVLTDTDPAAVGPLRRALRPRGFGVVLIDIDGRVALRRPAPMQVREISGLIDRMPSRRDETGSRRP
ncbi:DUF4174 domain-containing protein [Amaricoccus sp. W119]|uniref:DUF4174 domain-containing protein n=1 Tax=Amaricoccus sp. W119 TaxID=3391833 RepID=UPI0039A4CB40